MTAFPDLLLLDLAGPLAVQMCCSTVFVSSMYQVQIPATAFVIPNSWLYADLTLYEGMEGSLSVSMCWRRSLILWWESTGTAWTMMVAFQSSIRTGIGSKPLTGLLQLAGLQLPLTALPRASCMLSLRSAHPLCSHMTACTGVDSCFVVSPHLQIAQASCSMYCL